MFAILKNPRRLGAIAACVLLAAPAAALTQPVLAQNQAPAPAPASAPPQAQAQKPEQDQTPLSQEQLSQLVAPIALYPDNLLAQVLTASTYPLEVVMAARWSKENPNVKGDALDQAMQKQPWDPSVKGLTSVPQVLAMMSEQLDWTQQLGEAFLAQPDDITKSIQTLRAKAEATGNLKDSKELKVKKVKAPAPRSGVTAVVEEPEYIEIEPAEPDVVYVPVYDPVVVYGGWPYPAYRPFFWRPPGYVYAGAFGFGAAFFVGPALWTHYDWRYHRVWIDARRYNRFNHTRFATGRPLEWRHNPKHRGAPYKNAKLQQQFKGKPGTGPAPKGIGPTPKGAGAKGVGTPRVPQTPKTPAKPKTSGKPVTAPKPLTAPKPPADSAKPVTPTAGPKAVHPVAPPRAVGRPSGPKPPHPAGPAGPAGNRNRQP